MNLIGGPTYDPSKGPGNFIAGSAVPGGVVILHNMSPYDLKIVFGGDPTRNSIIHAWQPRKYDFCGILTTTIAYSVYYTPPAQVISAAPSSYLYGESFAPGEPIPESLPNYDRVSNIGNNVQVNSATNTLEQDVVSPFILSDMTPTKDSIVQNQLNIRSGISFNRQTDGSILRISISANSFKTSSPSSTYYLDLNPDGSTSWSTSHSNQPSYLTIATVTTDASGNISTVADTRPVSTTIFPGMSNIAGVQYINMYNLHVFKNIQADNLISVQGTFQITSNVGGEGYQQYIGRSYADLYFVPTSNDRPTTLVFWANPTVSAPITPVPVLTVGAIPQGSAAHIDTSGVVHANAPMYLLSGHQETGTCGGIYTAAGAGTYNGWVVNFKTIMTNNPTSISISNITVSNVAGVSFDYYSTVGFSIIVNSTAAGFTKYYVNYTTVGNCLLAVDSVARTVDHHCEQCGHVSTATPMSNVSIIDDGVMFGMHYVCPSCGVAEHFNPRLTPADELDTTPQGSGQYSSTRGEQSKLIRQLQSALGMVLTS